MGRSSPSNPLRELREWPFTLPHGIIALVSGPGDRPSQAELVRRTADGDEEAFADLFEPLGLRLKMFIRGRGGDLLGGDCSEEDVLQIVLARIWGLLPEFEYRGPAAFYGWVITITEHALSDRAKYLKAKGRGEVRRLDTATLQALPPQVRRRLEPRAARPRGAARSARSARLGRLFSLGYARVPRDGKNCRPRRLVVRPIRS
jgi:DNA-directed RNA polymerase specialized sigma24 family protein